MTRGQIGAAFVVGGLVGMILTAIGYAFAG